MRQKFRPGYRIFILIRKSYDSLTPILSGVGMPTFLPVRSHAGETQYRSGGGPKSSLGEKRFPVCSHGETWGC